MNYLEQGLALNTYFPVFFIGFVLGLIALMLIRKVLTKRLFVLSVSLYWSSQPSSLFSYYK